MTNQEHTASRWLGLDPELRSLSPELFYAVIHIWSDGMESLPRLSHLQRMYTGSVTLIIIVGQPSTPRSRNYHCSHFPDGNTEAQRRKMSHTVAHAEEAVELGFKPKTPESCRLCWRCSRDPCSPAPLMPHLPWHS